MSPSYVLGLVFALIIVVTVFMTMRNSGLKERYGLGGTSSRSSR